MNDFIMYFIREKVDFFFIFNSGYYAENIYITIFNIYYEKHEIRRKVEAFQPPFSEPSSSS